MNRIVVTKDFQSSDNGTRFVSVSGYKDCIEMRNSTTRVVLEPNLGGRVLSFQLNGAEILFQNPAQNGVFWDGKTKVQHPCAGRFDTGPEYGCFPHDEFWLGRWTAEIINPHCATLTSATLENGLQLVRQFTLSHDSSHLRCTQIFRNRGTASIRTFHWSRTFAVGSGIVLAPLPEHRRFPRGYALGIGATQIDFQPAEEPNVRIRENILEILGPPSKAKFIFDVEPGWLAYIAPNNLLFLKKIPVFPNRAYGEIAANNASIWYSSDENAPNWREGNHVVEIEPIGPLEIIEPGGECSFTEDWWLENFPFPKDRSVDLNQLRTIIQTAEGASHTTPNNEKTK